MLVVAGEAAVVVHETGFVVAFAPCRAVATSFTHEAAILVAGSPRRQVSAATVARPFRLRLDLSSRNRMDVCLSSI
jgi:hypothetical protein